MKLIPVVFLFGALPSLIGCGSHDSKTDTSQALKSHIPKPLPANNVNEIDTIQQQLDFHVGKLHLYGNIKYEADLSDSNRVIASILELDLNPKQRIPKKLLGQMRLQDEGVLHFYNRACFGKDTLTEEDFAGTYRFVDANLDGVPDIGIVYNPDTKNEGYTTWVNLKGKLVYWDGGSRSPVREVGAYEKERVIAFGNHAGGGIDDETYYKIVGDTTLIPIERWSTRNNKQRDSLIVINEKYEVGRWKKVKKIKHCVYCEE